MKYILLAFLASCSAQITTRSIPIKTPEIIQQDEPISKALRGKEVFRQRCMSCHVNPHTGGPICPPNYGSSLELVRLKVLEQKYPPGYKPKRNTHIMPRFPFLKDEIENLYEYLNSKE